MNGDTDYGYQFYPPCTPNHPGYERLSIWLRPHPTERHYDPERVHLPVISAGGIDTGVVQHPALPPFQWRVGVGRIRLTDRINKHVDAFSFGGSATITPAADATHLVIDSPAPIFALVATTPLAEELVSAVETILAEHQAQWDMSHPAARPFDERLAALEPRELYLACLLDLEERMHALLNAHYERAHHILAFIRQERRELETANRWPSNAATLDRLLKN